jgi:hypothetical protein
MGFVPPRLIYPSPEDERASRQRMLLDMQRANAALLQIANAGYRMSDLMPVPEQVENYNVTNDQDMELPLLPQKDFE